MQNSYDYVLNLRWTGNRGTGTSGVRDFDRTLTVEAPDRPPLTVSADVPFHGARDQWNPEQLLLASLSSCHMLSYFYVAVREGIVVTAYRDAPTAQLTVTRAGSGAITSAILQPVVSVADESMIEDAQRAHAAASELCFIKNSVNFSVSIQPTVDVASE